MSGWGWLCWTPCLDSGPVYPDPRPFSLPSSLPQWPQGGGFAKGRICIGELEVIKITAFQKIWSCAEFSRKCSGATFYRPIGIPDSFFSLGHYGQTNDKPSHGFVLVAREVESSGEIIGNTGDTRLPALEKPQDYKLVWCSNYGRNHHFGCLPCGYFWLPLPPEGYKTLGYVVTTSPSKPSLEEVRCVRSDLTESCETHEMIFNVGAEVLVFQVRNARPCHRSIWAKGLPVGTFSCTHINFGEEMEISCLKNFDSSLHAMPNLEQIHALIHHYGPTLIFHPKEIYLPSSIPWFFNNGATLYKKGETIGEYIDADGSNLPKGGTNDGQYWIDLPNDDRKNYVKYGRLESAELYVHVKPSLGGTFTDIAMWVFCPFNGPATIKIGVINVSMSKIGQHVGDWEHFTLRISNFTGELWSIYFSQHSGGEWVDASSLEYIAGNRAIVYSSKSGHASYPHPGNYLQGCEKLGIGVRNDAAQSVFSVDSSSKYKVVAAEYLGDIVTEPSWLQFMREWGPKITYSSRSELDKILSILPMNIKFSVESIFKRLPMELYGEEGPTGPKEKNNWEADERS
ncbi:Vacuolar protein sorting-associated protein 62 [Dioscorea alata]|uniref:Vacuolar protein sorting-associated protein 62 n=1 Tax=Dioscorea alata TaxID=55571 RepID=A0ACB7WRF7_DIOAL|nr:Vacuolar protein sorting-associated protein 62 [Dioscorea alata]